MHYFRREVLNEDAGVLRGRMQYLCLGKKKGKSGSFRPKCMTVQPAASPLLGEFIF